MSATRVLLTVGPGEAVSAAAEALQTGALPTKAQQVEALETEALQTEVLRLFDECAPRLRRYVRSCGLRPQAADDVVQEAFVLVFRHLRLGRSRQNLHGWLFRVSHRLALKHRARAARQQSREQWLHPELADAVIDRADDPEQRLTGRTYRRRLSAAMRTLPERQRQCVSLRAEGLRYREIARVLGISLGSVAKALAHAAQCLSRVKE